MILVDSCVWIDLLKGKKTKEVSFLEQISHYNSMEVVLSRIVYFEVLRGIRDELETKRVEKIFNQFISVDYNNSGFEQLVRIAKQVAKKGLNLPRLGDWLIFKTVLDHGLGLLTSDQDFHNLNKVYSFDLVTLPD